MRRHARPEIERDAIEMIAASSRAVAAALLQAIDVGIAEIPAARALGEVAAKGRNVADLWGGEALRARGNAGIGFLDARVSRNRCDRGKRADPRRAVRAPGNRCIALAGDIDQRAS